MVSEGRRGFAAADSRTALSKECCQPLILLERQLLLAGRAIVRSPVAREALNATIKL
jgi:hypothetical protein